MNKAESLKIAGFLDSAGYLNSDSFRNADVTVLNTCAVRQSAENKVTGMLGLLKGLQKERPNMSILLTGCFNGSNVDELKRRFPQVTLFFAPGDYSVLIERLERQSYNLITNPQQMRINEIKRPICFPVPIIQGCNNFCSYCIVPYRRGREISRPIREITGEVTSLVKEGIKEVTLLGQNVNSYGHDLPGQPDLADLLNELNNISGLARIRFLTNHPKDMSLKLIKAMSSLDKVCEHLNLALQSGDDKLLEAMKRGYTVEYFRGLVNVIRQYIPQISLSTDIIVGFPGESDEQFERTYTLLEDIAFDLVHVAVYSPRPGTLAWRKYKDDITMELKKKRFNEIERLQEGISARKNHYYQGKIVEVLVEGKKKGKWYGRSRNDKLTFFEEDEDCEGKILSVEVEKTSSWALQGKVRYNN